MISKVFDIDEFDKELVELSEQLGVYSQHPESVINEYSKKRFDKGGKRYRPMLLCATYYALAERPDHETVMLYGLVIEYIHNGLLDIDDVQDESPRRRDTPATWTVTGKEQAINVGLKNALANPYNPLALIAEKLTKKQIKKLLFLQHRVLDETAIGQGYDIKHRNSPELSTKDQIKIYIGKTSWYTTIWPMCAGAILADANDDVVDKLREVGEDLGIGFQIQDDLLNLEFPEDKEKKGRVYGKEPADDIMEGKPTYMRALFNELASEEDKRRFYELCGRRDLSIEERKEAVALMDKYFIREKAKQVANKYVQGALERLKKVIPPSEKTKHLYDFFGFTVERTW